MLGKAAAPPGGTELQGWAPLKARAENLVVEQRPSVLPGHPRTSSNVVAVKEVPRALQVSLLGQCHSTDWSKSRRCEAQPCSGTAPTTGTACKDTSLGKIKRCFIKSVSQSKDQQTGADNNRVINKAKPGIFLDPPTAVISDFTEQAQKRPLQQSFVFAA